MSQLKRSVVTVAASTVACIIVLAMLDTRSRYNILQPQFEVVEEVELVGGETLSLRFWELVNILQRGSKANFALTKTTLPNLWRQETADFSHRGDDRILAQLIWGMEATNLTDVKTIYLPDSFHWWGKTEWNSPHLVNEEDCPEYPGILGKCAFSQSPNSIDALITVRDASHKKEFDVPSNILRFYYMLESPINSRAVLKRTNDLAATYYRGSDINTPYGKWVYNDPTVRFQDQEKAFSSGKTKMAAIFTSNCHPWNDRMGYVEELQKHVEVDVFGACGNKQCPKNNQKECFKMLKKDYRFYLSFENSNCRDYVTEKLFMNAFENDVIPIVLGAHPNDYQAMCPEKSYIHVEDYPSPEELGDHLKQLASNSTEYNSYFQWKGTGKFVNTNFLCRVCAMVHYADVVKPPKRTSEYFWNAETAVKDKFCLPPKDWYWSRKNNGSKRINKST